jgi:hypothetical protein
MRRKRNGQWAHVDRERKPRAKKMSREEEVEYVGTLTLKAIAGGQAFTAKIMAKDAARLAYQILGRE